ncbi:hypothetical protein [Streptosporangium jomthongense]|uniref:Uncharacterized protein n=1 Tax=Streptosporangium jomthongense TaxID=1193683 RepID=A0ABV8FBZ2_9ACTN
MTRTPAPPDPAEHGPFDIQIIDGRIVLAGIETPLDAVDALLGARQLRAAAERAVAEPAETLPPRPSRHGLRLVDTTGGA